MKKLLEGFILFARMHVRPVFTLAQIQENTVEELFLKYAFAPLQICIRTFPSPSEWMQWLYELMPIHKIFSGEFISERINAAHVFAPERMQENIPGNFLCTSFMPGGTRGGDLRGDI